MSSLALLMSQCNLPLLHLLLPSEQWVRADANDQIPRVSALCMASFCQGNSFTLSASGAGAFVGIDEIDAGSSILAGVRQALIDLL